MKSVKNKIYASILCICTMMMGGLSADCTAKSVKMETDGLGNAVSVWELQEGGVTIIQAAYRAATGTEWSAPHQLSLSNQVLGNFRSSDPKLAINSQGQTVAIWRSIDPSSSKSHLYAATLSLQGTVSWTTAALVSDVNEPLQNMLGEAPYSVKVGENGKSTVIWQTVLQEVKSSTSTVSEGSNSWTSPVLVVGTGCP